MEWSYDINAWISPNKEDCLCPFCHSELNIGFQKCDCGQSFNVERIYDSESGSEKFVVTQENDEMQDLVDKLERKQNSYLDLL